MNFWFLYHATMKWFLQTTDRYLVSGKFKLHVLDEMHHKGYTRKGVARLSTAVANLHTVESTAHVQQFLNRIHDTKVDIITQHLAADIDFK